MHIDIIEYTDTVLLFISLHLLKIPLDEIHIPMRLAICARATAIRRRVEISAPTPDHGAKGFGSWVGRFDGRCIGPGTVPHFVVSSCIRMNIPVSTVPEHGFIVQVIEHDPTVGRRSKSGGQMVDPSGSVAGSDGNTGIKRVIASDRCSICVVAIAAVWVPF